MGFQDTLNYILFKNPISAGVTEYGKIAVQTVIPRAQKKSDIVKTEICSLPIWKHAYAGSSFVRLAGIFGASAVALGAYGAHALYPKEGNEELKTIFETANRYHFIHTVALLGVPLCRWSKTSGTCLVVGMVLFCGTCYYRALTGSKQFQRLTPLGGTLLIFGWLAMML